MAHSNLAQLKMLAHEDAKAIGWAGRAITLAEQMAGDWRTAATTWRRLGCPYEALRALAESGHEEALREALLGFEALGARPAARTTPRRLRHLGVKGIPRGPRPSTRSHPANLTTP